MGDAAKRILEMALALPADERRHLIDALVASSEVLDPEWEEAWAHEITARVARDPTADRSVPAHEAIAAARARLSRP